MKIAIAGAGVSGLATAHMLHREHEITVFEAAALAGGHANPVRVDTEDATHHVDTGFIVFNDRNYPNFERLLSSLRVASQPSDMASESPSEATPNTTGPRGWAVGQTRAPRHAHGMLGFAERPWWRTIVGGSRTYVDRHAAVARTPAA